MTDSPSAGVTASSADVADAPAVDVEADLTVAVDGSAVRVRGYGDRVVVEAPSLAALRSLAGAADPLPAARGATAAVLDRADVDVDVRVRGASVARLGPDVEPGPLSRWAGVAPARLALGGVALAALSALRGRDRSGPS